MKKIKWNIRSYLKLLRVKHYLKNSLIYIPLLFSGKLFNINDLIQVFIGFIVFSLTASIVYIINDINDLENDKKHPTKCMRPIASGKISILNARIAVCVLIALVVITCLLIQEKNYLIYTILVLFLVSNLIYSKGLKNIPIADVCILVLGYILRIYFGALLINVHISNWLYLTVISLAFFLGLGKRRNEMLRQGDISRMVLKRYNKEFLDKNMYMFLGITIVFYSLWCNNIQDSLNNNIIMGTIPLVISICMKYSLIIEGDSDGDPIEVVLSDKVLVTLIMTYIILIAIILYGVNKL